MPLHYFEKTSLIVIVTFFLTLSSYFSETFDRHLALGILRAPAGLDCSKYSGASDIAACFENKNGKAFLNSSFISVEVLSKSDSSNASTNGLHAKGNFGFFDQEKSLSYTTTFSIFLLSLFFHSPLMRTQELAVVTVHQIHHHRTRP